MGYALRALERVAAVELRVGLFVFAVTNGSSLKTPENAKNVLAVGASQKGANADNHCSGGVGPTSDGRTYRVRWRASFSLPGR